MIMSEKNSIFVEVLGSTPLIKTIDFLLTFDGFDYSKNQVAKEVEVSRMTMDKIWERLIKFKIIAKTRIVGRAEMYKLNKDNPLVKELMNFDIKISATAARKNMISIKA